MFAQQMLGQDASTQNVPPIGELFASDANSSSAMQLAGSGMAVYSGSELSAGIAPATLKLARGGQVRICPNSGLNVTGSGQGLMLATGAGALAGGCRIMVGPRAAERAGAVAPRAGGQHHAGRRAPAGHRQAVRCRRAHPRGQLEPALRQLRKQPHPGCQQRRGSGEVGAVIGAR